jgi:hypothetical protein
VFCLGAQGSAGARARHLRRAGRKRQLALCVCARPVPASPRVFVGGPQRGAWPRAAVRGSAARAHVDKWRARTVTHSGWQETANPELLQGESAADSEAASNA